MNYLTLGTEELTPEEDKDKYDNEIEELEEAIEHEEDIEIDN